MAEANRLGCVLFQLAPWIRFSESALARAKLAVVCVDAPQAPNAIPRVAEATTDTAILRLHGRNVAGWLAQLQGEEPSIREKYDYLYREDELVEIVGEARVLGAKAKRVFILFNNNKDYPARNALQALGLLGKPPVDFDGLKAAWKTAHPRRGAGKDLPGGLFN